MLTEDTAIILITAVCLTSVLVAALVKLRILELVFKIVLVVVEAVDSSCNLVLLASKETVLVTVLDIVLTIDLTIVDTETLVTDMFFSALRTSVFALLLVTVKD